jgi:hypothetical protein
VCPVGFLMTETAVGIRCAGERPRDWGGKGGSTISFWSQEPGQAVVPESGQRGTHRNVSLLFSHKYLLSSSFGQELSFGWGYR